MEGLDDKNACPRMARTRSAARIKDNDLVGTAGEVDLSACHVRVLTVLPR